MSTKDESAFERRMVKALLAAKPGLPFRSWRSSDNPEVDVLVATTDGGIIGVEVTRLHHVGGEAGRKWEEKQERIVNLAAQLYGHRHLPNLEVVVFFSKWLDPTKRRHEEVATDLVEFVVEHTPPVDEALDFDLTDAPLPSLPYGVDRISIRQFPQLPNHWHCLRGGLVGDITADEVRERLAAKENRRRQYRGSYQERWLLLAVGAEGRSTQGNIPPHLRETLFVSSFDRVFVVRPPSEALELRISRVC